MAPDPLTLPAIHASHIGIWIADAHGRVERVGARRRHGPITLPSRAAA